MRNYTLILVSLLLFLLGISLLLTPSIQNTLSETYLYTSQTTYINKGDSIQNLQPSLLIFNTFMNTSWQHAYLETTNMAYKLTSDQDGNTVLVFNISSLLPGENITFSYSFRLEKEKHASLPEINFTSSGSLSDISEKLREEYCISEGTWVVDPTLESLVDTIWVSEDKTSNVLRLVTSLADWIGTNIRSISHDVPYYPSETYHSREGDCDDQANLLIALCRILDIPAYLQVGALKWSSSTDTYWSEHVASHLVSVTYHAWAMIYIPPWGWLPFDMTLGWNAFNPFAVIKSAKIWGLDAMPLLNITRSDWPGEGRLQKTELVSSTLYITQNDALISENPSSFLTLLYDRRVWVATLGLLSITTILFTINLKKENQV